MEDYFQILFRTLFLYVLILVVFRLMGKREVGELGLSDIVVYMMIAEVASFALDNPDRSLFHSILPILILLVIQYTNSVLVMRHKKLREIVDGNPTLIILDGQLMEQEMKKQRYNLGDLMQQLREEGASSIREISYAFLEQSGKLSVFYKDEDPFILSLILDGEVDNRHLNFLGKDEQWLKEQLASKGYYDTTQIFYCSYENGELYIQLKDS